MMFPIATEMLIRMLLTAAVLDLAFLFPILFVLYLALWNAKDVLRNLNIDWQVERDMRKWHVQKYTKEQQKEASLSK
jgi:hypothetical protein